MEKRAEAHVAAAVCKRPQQKVFYIHTHRRRAAPCALAPPAKDTAGFAGDYWCPSPTRPDVDAHRSKGARRLEKQQA